MIWTPVRWRSLALGATAFLLVVCGCAGKPPGAAPRGAAPVPFPSLTAEDKAQLQGWRPEMDALGRQLVESFTVEQLRKANQATLTHKDEPQADPSTSLKWEELTPQQQALLRDYSARYTKGYVLLHKWDENPPQEAPLQRVLEALLAPVEETQLYAIGYIWDQGGKDWKPFLDYAGDMWRGGIFIGQFVSKDLRGGLEPTPALKAAGINFREYGLMQHWEGSAAYSHATPECGEGPYHTGRSRQNEGNKQ